MAARAVSYHCDDKPHDQLGIEPKSPPFFMVSMARRSLGEPLRIVGNTTINFPTQTSQNQAPRSGNDPDPSASKAEMLSFTLAGHYLACNFLWQLEHKTSHLFISFIVFLRLQY